MRNLPARLFRALVVAVVVLSLSAGGHMGGGGSLPGPAAVVVLIAATMLAVVIAAQRTLNLPTLLGILGGAQFAFHYAFQLPAQATGCLPATDASHSMPACHSDSAAAHQHGLDDGMGAGMLAAHLIATLAAAVVITRGEDALYAAAAWLRPLFHTLRPTAAPILVRTGANVHGRTPRAVPFLASPPLRGPPAFHCSR